MEEAEDQEDKAVMWSANWMLQLTTIPLQINSDKKACNYSLSIVNL